MKKSISSRLKEIMRDRNLKQVDILNKTLPFQTKYNVRLAKNDLSQYVNGKVEPNQERVYILAKALNVSEAWLLGYDVPKQRVNKSNNEDITSIYNQLNNERQKKVYDFADLQLKQQNGELEQNNILIAAHSKEDLTDDERQQINDFIDKIRKEKRK